MYYQSSTARDHYELLGLPRDASIEAVLYAKDALMQKARESNITYDEPTPEDKAALDAKLDQISEAASTLSDPTARARYDQSLWSTPAAFAPTTFALPSPPADTYAYSHPATVTHQLPRRPSAPVTDRAPDYYRPGRAPDYYRPDRAQDHHTQDHAGVSYMQDRTQDFYSQAAIYPDIWIAMRDGRIRSDNTRWPAPRPREGSPRYRGAWQNHRNGQNAPQASDAYYQQAWRVLGSYEPAVRRSPEYESMDGPF